MTGRCADCAWWAGPVGSSEPAEGICEGNRLHVCPGEVSVEAGKRGPSQSNFRVPETFGCPFWGAKLGSAGCCFALVDDPGDDCHGLFFIKCERGYHRPCAGGGKRTPHPPFSNESL